jgi:hypothetical protein
MIRPVVKTNEPPISIHKLVDEEEARESLDTLADVMVDYLCSTSDASPEWHERVKLCWSNISYLLKERINAPAQ